MIDRHPRMSLWSVQHFDIYIQIYIYIYYKCVYYLCVYICISECWTDNRLICACLSITVCRKLRCGAKAPKRIDVSKLNWPEKLVQYQVAVQAIVLDDNCDPSVSFSERLYQAASSMLGFMERKHQDWFKENEGLVSTLLEEKKVIHDTLLSCHFSVSEQEKLEKESRESKADVQRELQAA